MKRIFQKNGYEVWKIGFIKYLIINKIEGVYKYAYGKDGVKNILKSLNLID